MNWQFNFLEGSKKYNFNAEVTWTTYQIEDIKISGEGISAILQNNRPLLVAIESKLPITWRVIHGEIKDSVLLARIKKELENHLKKPAIKLTQPVEKQSNVPVRKAMRA